MTGVDIDNNFDWKIDKSFSNYLSPAQKNNLFMNALTNAAENKFSGLDWKTLDEISAHRTTERINVPQNNVHHISPLLVTSMTLAIGIVTVKTILPHYLVTGNQVSFSSVAQSAPNFNASPKTVTVIDDNTFTFAFGGTLTAYPANSATITTAGTIGDYLHLYTIKAKFLKQIKNATVKSVKATSPIQVVFTGRNSLRDHDHINLSGMTCPQANGDWYVKVLNPFTIALYIDRHLSAPSIAGPAISPETGIVSRYYYKKCTPVYSDRKGDPLEDFTPDFPGFEKADTVIKLYPLHSTCLETTSDYLRRPPIFIDVTDATTDLETIWPIKFIYFIVEEAKLLYASPTRDLYLSNDAQMEIVKNP